MVNDNEFNLKNIEEEIAEFWKKNDIPDKAVNLNNDKLDEKEFLFLEGPPGTTGKMHIGHVRGRTIKDIMFRLKTMQGYYVPRQAGWDMQGLPVELEAEKEMGVESKTDIEEKIGAENFIENCKEVAYKYKDEWESLSKNLGMWMDWDNPYLTLSDKHMELVWKVISKAHEKGLLVRKLNSNPVCPSCDTALSQHEVDQGYKDKEDHSIYVKFPVKGTSNEYILIWTTTPWTIPSNMAVGVHPDYDYVKVKLNDQKLILAKEKVDEIVNKLDLEDYEIVEEMKGEALDGIQYEHPLKDLVPKHQEFNDSGYQHRIFLQDFVTLEEGTGCVHMAPGHGPEDFEAAQENEIPVFCPVSSTGEYQEEAGKYEDENVFDANSVVITDLKDKDRLLHSEKITHSYPHCWRCKKPLIHIANKQWYIETDKLKEKMISENNNVDWKPEYVGQKRFGNWLRNLEDNCISRQKYWGTPLPVWECDDCGNLLVMDSKEEMKQYAKELPDHLELHRPWIDRVILECPNCNSDMHRFSDVMDVWLDSSVAPDATLNYMGKNSFQQFDFITEGIDQTRGWYYSMLFSNVILREKVPYKSVLNQELICNADGEKMSSSKGNAVWADEALNKWSSDVLRFYLMWKAKPFERLNFDPVDMENLEGGFFNILWNTKNFYQRYCSEIDTNGAAELMKKEDKWILSKLNTVIQNIEEDYEDYDITNVVKELKKFLVEDFSRFYIKLVRHRTWPRYDNPDKKSAVMTIRSVLTRFNKLLAPICPYITEEIYQELNDNSDLESIHLSEWPDVDDRYELDDLEEQMDIVRDVIDTANSVRQDAGIGLRYPLEKITVSCSTKAKKAIQQLEDIVKRMLNIKKIEFDEVDKVTELKLDYSKVGPKYGDDVKEIEQELVDSDHDELVEELREKGSVNLGDYQLNENEIEVREHTPENVAGESFSSGTLYLKTDQSRELVKESFFKELTRNIQIERKNNELNVEQYIELKIDADSEIVDFVQEQSDVLRKETGVKEVKNVTLTDAREVEYKDLEAKISIEIL